MAINILCVFLYTIFLMGQDTDTSITISHFMYTDIEGIPIILDEGGENSFFLNMYNPGILNDYRINHVMVDMALQFPNDEYNNPDCVAFLKGTST